MAVFSILDLAPVPQGSTAADALHNALDLAQHAERLGYRRYWVAEHHNMVGIASAATSVVVGYLAGGTHTIRVGAGGIMLPSHAPLVIAEQFGTLDAPYPGRIDLGLGRAPGGVAQGSARQRAEWNGNGGTDGRTAQALRRDPQAADSFPQDVMGLQALLGPPQPGQAVQAVPGAGSAVKLWVLGSSLFGAQLAAHLGLPYAFASHFAPAALTEALQVYRARFRPSAQLDRPHAMAGVNVVAVETDAQARRLFTSTQQAFVNMLRATRGKLPPPVDDIEAYWSPAEKRQASGMLACSFVGSADTVRDELAAFLDDTGADELMVACNIFDHAARRRSYEILAQVRTALTREVVGS